MAHTATSTLNLGVHAVIGMAATSTTRQNAGLILPGPWSTLAEQHACKIKNCVSELDLIVGPAHLHGSSGTCRLQLAELLQCAQGKIKHDQDKESCSPKTNLLHPLLKLMHICLLSLHHRFRP